MSKRPPSLPPIAAAAWRGGRARRAASNAATESAPHRRDRPLSPVPARSLRRPDGQERGRHSAYTFSEIANALSLSAAALRRSFAPSTASPTAISIGGSDDPTSPIAARPAWMLTAILTLLSRRWPSRLLRSAMTPRRSPPPPAAPPARHWRRLMSEQRADAVELDIAQRATGSADGVADALDIQRQHIQQILRQVVAGQVGAIAEVAEQHGDLALGVPSRRRGPVDRARGANQRHDRDIALRPQLAGQAHVRRGADAAERGLLVVGRRRTKLLAIRHPHPQVEQRARPPHMAACGRWKLRLASSTDHPRGTRTVWPGYDSETRRLPRRSIRLRISRAMKAAPMMEKYQLRRLSFHCASANRCAALLGFKYSNAAAAAADWQPALSPWR